MAKNWIFRTRKDGAKDLPPYFDTLADRLGISLKLARLLWLRGLDEPAQLEEYLNPRLKYLARPEE